MRRRGFESHPVLLFFDNSIRIHGTHDVAAACCLAMADVRVRLSLGALVDRRVGKFGNPPASGAGDRRFKSNRADSIAVGPVLVRAGGC